MFCWFVYLHCPSLSGMTWRNRTNQKSCGNVSKMLQETYLQSYSTVKSLRHLCANSVQWGCCKKMSEIYFLYLLTKLNQNVVWHPLRLASFALGALARSFSGSFAGKSLETSWKRCHRSSGFNLSQFVLFLQIIPDILERSKVKKNTNKVKNEV